MAMAETEDDRWWKYFLRPPSASTKSPPHICTGLTNDSLELSFEDKYVVVNSDGIVTINEGSRKKVLLSHVVVVVAVSDVNCGSRDR